MTLTAKPRTEFGAEKIDYAKAGIMPGVFIFNAWIAKEG